MALTDHVAILTHHALAQPIPNKKKAGNPLQYFAVVAFPPAAQDDLRALLTAVAPGGSLVGQSIRVPRNSQQTKPIPGIPSDWFVIRAATQYPPYLADETGKQLDQVTQTNDIRLKFYPGKRIRAALAAYPWNYQGQSGLSFNLNGVMAVSDGERLAIGNDAANAFAAYSEGGGSAAANPFASTATTVAAQQTGNAVTSNGGVTGNPGADPFQQAGVGATNTAANPFA